MTQAAETKTATSAVATSQAPDKDLDVPPDRPTKRPRVSLEIEVKDRTTGTDASRQAVLLANELLEGILTFLPPKQLFADQRVCKQWRDVIVSSPGLQKKMFLRVDELPPLNWGFKAEYWHPDPSRRGELRSLGDRPPSLPWRQVTPVILSPHLKTVTYDGEEDSKHSVTFDLPHNLPIGQHSSIHDTYFCNPRCYKFAFGFDIKFEPAIPKYGRLIVSALQFQTGRALKVGEALDRAMSLRTDAELCKEVYGDKSIKTKKYRNITVTQIIHKLQREHGCTAILCESSVMVLENVFLQTSSSRWRLMLLMRRRSRNDAKCASWQQKNC